jgi:peptidoglycan L-alanyl-D-glutamate endopeptidase CwlK
MNLADTIKACQRRVNVPDDGKAGILTWTGIAYALGVITPPASEATDLLDERSETNLATVLPVVKERARRFLHKLNATLRDEFHPDLVARIISGTRSCEEQNALYAIGRTVPGKIVTKARCGESNHNFGIAFDIGIFDGRDYLEESSWYEKAGAIGKSFGFVWGGDWESIQDQPHFEFHPIWAEGMSEREMLAELRRRQQKGIAIV